MRPGSHAAGIGIPVAAPPGRTVVKNAARNSPEKSPISVSAAREGVYVAVSVSDEGRGIPAESLPHLFRKFSRIEAGEQGETPA